MPTLNDLLGRAVPGGAILIRGVTADTRALEPGFLFAALPGSARDGRCFIAEAVAKGAAAILAPEGTPAATGTAVSVTDPEPRRRFALVAARFFAAQPATLAAVTGTNGKTSVVTFTRQIWAAAGFSAASLGTLGLVAPGRHLKGTLTTPDPANLHRILAELARAGVTHGAFEASSHGLDQYRLDGVAIKAAAFTNLTRDHLDYHGDMEGYRAAKRRLFTELLPRDGTAVLNADNEEGRLLAQLCRDLGRKVATYGEAGAFVRIEKRAATPHGQDLSLAVEDREYRLHLPLAGGFQAQNAACALALALVTGADEGKAVAALERLEGVAGRMQLVGTTPEGAPAYVDYAHTPDALETVLSALRPHARGRLVVVFGCGGDRDPGKRPMMGRIARALADHVFVTDDNPRNEDPAAIRAQILAACHGAAEIGSRHDAIRAAIASLEEGDVLVVAGKGHESGQIVKGEILPFDDAAEIQAALEDRR